jgi:glutamyl-tRNA synthetase
LTNTARQVQVYNALGWLLPIFAHIPLVHGPDGAKLSKRHGAEGVDEYRAMGYLPAALRNYLMRLGWSHGDDEIFSTEQAIEWFDIDGIGKSPARFDFAKLADLNGHYLRQMSDHELLKRIDDVLPSVEDGAELKAKLAADGSVKLVRLLPALKERAKTLRELIDSARFLADERPLVLDTKAAQLLDPAAKKNLAALLPRLEAITDWRAITLEAEARTFAATMGAKLGNIAQPLRAALTGRSVSPPVFEVMAVLGPKETLARIKDQIQ